MEYAHEARPCGAFFDGPVRALGYQGPAQCGYLYGIHIFWFVTALLSCALEVYNEDHRFDPYAPDSLFRSIEERQSDPVELGAQLSDGSIEWLPGGTYYQQSGGWALKDLTVLWKLVDVIGMLVKRKFTVPEVLPTTLDGWVGAVMSSLGVNLGRPVSGRCMDIADTPLTAAVDAVSGMTCGNILRFACMAAVAWPHQDYSTGYLRVSKLAATQGNHITRRQYAGKSSDGGQRRCR